MLHGLNLSDASLNLDVSTDASEVSTLSNDGFGYCFGGVRSTFGVIGGRWCFSICTLEHQAINVQDTQHLRSSAIVRVGVSTLGTDVARLGEVKLRSDAPEVVSCGWNSSGSIVSGSQFSPPPLNCREEERRLAACIGLGERWRAAEICRMVTIFIDLHGDAGGAVYAAKANRPPFLLTRLPSKPSGSKDALFPHLLLRNARVRLDLTSPPAGCHQTFGLFEPGGQYQAIMGALKTRSCACVAPWLLGPPPACELVMMVGLPGSGKTTWAEAHAASHPNKRFLLLSPEAVLDSMRVLSLRKARLFAQDQASRNPSAPLGHPYPATPQEQQQQQQQGEGSGAAGVVSAAVDLQAALTDFDPLAPYAQLAMSVYEVWLKRAVARRRNCILDQTHVSRSKRVALLAPFKSAGFRLVASLAVPPMNWLALWQQQSLSEGRGRYVPDSVMAALMASFQLPCLGGPEGFQELLLVHPPPGGWDAMLPGGAGQPAAQQGLKRALLHLECKVVRQHRKLAKRWKARHPPGGEPLTTPSATSQAPGQEMVGRVRALLTGTLLAGPSASQLPQGQHGHQAVHAAT
ncbi:hypothetical protein V8C86DRAFT_2530235 [Haematococcus lacustris]